MTLPAALRRHVLARRWRCFAVLCLAFAVFGAGTVNLFNLLRANLELIAQHGWTALGDGAAQQLLELLLTLALSMAAYIVFKACEYSLVHGLTDPEKDDPPS